jgi:lysophospholipase L1-like esterase
MLSSARVLSLVLVALVGLGAFLIASPPGSARAAVTTVKVMPLGDSITGSPGCWRQLLWSRLQTTGFTNVDFVGSLNDSTSCGTLYDGDNEGHGGFLATNILSQNQLPGWLASATPDVVMMHLGTNDVWSNIPAGTILTTYSGLVDQMRASNPKMRILVAQILPMNPSGCAECAQRVIDLNMAIPAWAAGKSTAASPITVVDAWTGFSDATDTYDGVHPNDAGNQKMSNAWYPALTAAVTAVAGGSSTPTPTPTRTTPTPTATATPTATSTPTPTGSSTKACSATFTVSNSWTGGFIGSVRVTAGSGAIAKWTVGLTLPSGTAITNLWNGQLTGSTVTSMSYNGSIAAGGSTDFGFQGSGSATGLTVASCTAT